MIQKAVRPKSQPEFVEALRKRIPVEYPPGYRPEPANFRVLYDAYTKYRIMFIKKFDYLRHRNEKNVPECHDKDTGLIGLYLNGIDQFSYPRTTYLSRISHDLRSGFKGTEGFDKFLTAFYAILQRDLGLHQQAKDLNISINLKLNDSTQSNRPKVESTPDKKPNSDPKKRPFIPFKAKNKFNALLEEASEDNFENFDEEKFGTYDDDPNYEPQEEAENNAEENINDIQEELFAMSSDRPNACFALLFFNECKNQSKCKYDHSHAVLTKGHAFYLDLLNKSPYKYPSNSQNRGAQASGIPRYSPKIQSHPQPKLHNVEEVKMKEEMTKENN
jgi:hypothetical protein